MYAPRLALVAPLNFLFVLDSSFAFFLMMFAVLNGGGPWSPQLPDLPSRSGAMNTISRTGETSSEKGNQ
jgi:hypothetical protein